MMKDLVKNKTMRPFQDFILLNNSVKIIVTKKNNNKISSKVIIKAKKIRVKLKKNYLIINLFVLDSVTFLNLLLIIKANCQKKNIRASFTIKC